MRALVLAGGGAKGSFTAGVLQRFGPNHFDMVVGCSSGALNAVGYSHLGSRGLLQFWEGIKGRGDVFGINWTLMDGIFNTKPLRKKVSGVIKSPATVPVYVNKVCLETGDLEFTKSGEQGYEDAIVASCSLPGIVVPVKMGGKTYVDGGVRQNCPLRLPIDLGCDEITLVLCSRPQLDKWTPPKRDIPLVSYLARSLDLSLYEILMDDLKEVEKKNRQPDKRHINVQVFAPTKNYMGTTEFDPKLIQVAIEAGLRAEPQISVGGDR